MNDFKKLDNQNFHQYIWAMDELVQSGKYKNWKEITPFVNAELFGDDESQYRDESAYRKGVKYARDYYEAGCFGSNSEDEYYKKLQNEKREMQKERQKISDERIEYKRLIRQEARKESYADMVKQVVCENTKPIEMGIEYKTFDSNTDLLCHFTDVHTGIEINNYKNVFNQDVLKDRVKRYIVKVLRIREQHASQNCHLVIGEVISGLIHNNLRIQNNMDIMEQFKYISELISAMLVEFANSFNDIYVYITQGNHSRISPKKEDALDGENMDALLPFYLKARMQNIKNVHICDNVIEPEIAMFNIRGNHVFAAHGHKDSPKNVVQNFTMMFGIKPDIVLLGHRHTNGLTTVYDTKVIESGCVSGSDEYAISIRKTNKPEQTISVVDENGLVCLYDIQLD